MTACRLSSISAFFWSSADITPRSRRWRAARAPLTGGPSAPLSTLRGGEGGMRQSFASLRRMKRVCTCQSESLKICWSPHVLGGQRVCNGSVKHCSPCCRHPRPVANGRRHPGWCPACTSWGIPHAAPSSCNLLNQPPSQLWPSVISALIRLLIFLDDAQQVHVVGSVDLRWQVG